MAQLGRISGPLLEQNLAREGIDRRQDAIVRDPPCPYESPAILTCHSRLFTFLRPGALSEAIIR